MPAPAKIESLARGTGTAGGTERAAPPPPEGVTAFELPPPAPPVPAARAAGGRGLALSFLLAVVAPLAAAAIYLAVFAAEQFASTAGFSVRREEAAMPVDLFGGLAGLSGSSSSDTDILNAFLASQELVQAIDAELDLRAMFSRVHERDPVFGFDPEGTIEDLVAYWRRMVRVSYDAGTGIIELRVRAFDPGEARAIAEAAFARSSALVNGLTEAARADATRYAAEDLAAAQARLRAAREALTAFRMRTQIVDPRADVSGQMGLLTSLQAQLADELIRLDLLREHTREGDPRLAEAARRIAVIEARIAAERQRLGGATGPSAGGGAGADTAGGGYAALVAEYERLALEVTFSEEAYASARAAHDLARAEAKRQTRYLAAHIRPTLAERATAPDPVVILGVGGLFLVLAWALGTLVVLSVRDRR